MKNKKLKPILPTLKEKKRYIAFEVISKSRLTKEAVKSAIISSSMAYLGKLGYSKAGVQFMNKWNKDNSRGLVKVNNKHVDNFRSSLLFIDRIGNKNAIMRTAGVSGILKKAEERYLN